MSKQDVSKAYNQLVELCNDYKWPEVLTWFDTVPTSFMGDVLSRHHGCQLLISHAMASDMPDEVLQRFIDNDNIDQSMFQQKDEHVGHLPFHLTSHVSSKIEVVKMVLKQYPAAIHTTKKDDSYPLHLAAGFNSLEIVKYIYHQYPQAIRMKTIHGLTPLALCAFKSSNPEIVSFLIDQYPEALNVTENGKTPLESPRNIIKDATNRPSPPSSKRQRRNTIFRYKRTSATISNSN